MRITKNKTKLLFTLFVTGISLSIASCTNLSGEAKRLSKIDDQVFSEPLREPKTVSLQNEQVSINTVREDGAIVRTQIKKAPTLSIKQKADVANDFILPNLSSDAQIDRLSFNNMPISAFINEVFGNQLGLSFVIQPKVANAEDLVTMRLASSVDHKTLYKVAVQTLAPYGVTTEISDDILVFGYSENATANETPLLISGRTLPSVPPTNRPLFYVYPLSYLKANNVIPHLTQLFKQNELKVQHDLFSNSIIFQGQQSKIEQGIAAAQLFDKPEMNGMYSNVVTPEGSDVKELSDNLQKILSTEGFAVGIGDQPGVAVRLLPLESVGQLIVFAKSRDVLSHIESWINTIEVKRQSEIEEGFFSYIVQNTLASHVVEVLSQLGVANYAASRDRQQESGPVGNITDDQNRRQSINRERTNTSSQASDGGMYTVDEQSNTILFKGSGKEWLDVLPVIKRLDKPAPSVMIEAIIVEISLTDQEETGIQWLAKSNVGKYSGQGGTAFKLDNAGSGFSFTFDSAGVTRATINAFYQNDKANIRSRPRIMVKSGEEANFNALTRIPVTTSAVRSAEDADAPVIQNVTYLDTGVILEIKPTVHASGFVDLEIAQTLSQASPISGAADNPRIIERNVNTKVTLRDGGSVLIGGLISSNTSDGSRGIPLLGRIPVIGKLFSTDSDRQERTELMIMIIPYVSNSPEESESLTDELQLERIKSLSIN